MRSGFTWILGGTVINAVSQWLVVIILARLGNVELVGIYQYTLSFAAPALILARLNMSTVLATDATETFDFSHYLTARLLLTAICVAGLLGAAALSKSYTAGLSVLAGVLLFKAFEGMSDIFSGQLQKYGMLRVVGTSTAFRGAALVLAILVSTLMTWRLAAGLLLAGALSATVFYLVDFAALMKRRQRLLSADWPRIGDLVRRCVPTGMVMVAATFSVNIPVYVINDVLGLTAVGYYSALILFVAAAGMLASAVSQTMAASLSVLYVNEPARFWSRLRQMLVFGATITVFGIGAARFLGEDLLRLLYGFEYRELRSELVWVAAAAGLSIVGAFLGLALTIGRFFKVELALTILSLLVVWSMAVSLVPTHGLTGAIWALMAGIAMRAIFSAAMLWWLRLGVTTAPG